MNVIESEKAATCCSNCGCQNDAARCLGSILIGRISSDCPEIDGLEKQFEWVGTGWRAKDPIPNDCLILNHLFIHSGIRCEPDACNGIPGCCQYVLLFDAVDCCLGEVYPSECSCNPLRLKYSGIQCGGGPQGPNSGGGYTYLCTCDCDYPTSLDIEFREV